MSDAQNYYQEKTMNQKVIADLKVNKRAYLAGELGARNTPVVNHEGMPAFHRGLGEQLVQALTTGFFDNTFYASSGELSQDAYPILARACSEDPVLLAQASIEARERGLRRATPLIGLGMLSGGRGVTKEAFLGAFDQVAQIETDLTDFGDLILGDTILGRSTLGGMAHLALKRWLSRYGIAELSALKYGSSAKNGLTLAGLLKLTHPVPPTAADAERFAWLLKGATALGGNERLNPQIRAFERLKRTTDEAEACRLIREGRLPMRVVFPVLKSVTPALWAELLRQTTYTNLIRSLAMFTRRGVFAEKANVAYVVERLTDNRAIAKSGLLPFYFLKAHRAYKVTEGAAPEIVEALSHALELCFVNVPDLPGGEMVVATDVSYSMTNMMAEEVERESKDSKTEKSAEEKKDVRLPKASFKFIDIAGILSGALIRKAKGHVHVLPFDTSVHSWQESWSRESIMAIANRFAAFGGGGTALCAPIDHITQRKLKVKTFVAVTDNEDWVGRGFLEAWSRYRAQVNPEAQAYLVTIAPYQAVVVPPSQESVHFVYGWSDEALSYVAKGIAGGGSQIDHVRKIKLGLPNPRRKGDRSHAVEASADEED